MVIKGDKLFLCGGGEALPLDLIGGSLTAAADLPFLLVRHC